MEYGPPMSETNPLIDDPIFRVRLKSAVASVRCMGGSVAKATVDSGTKTRPRPRPWTIPLSMMSALSIWGEKPVIMYRE